MRFILTAALLVASLVSVPSYSLADDDTLLPLPPPTPLVFVGRGEEGMPDDDVLEPKYTAGPDKGGRGVEGEEGSEQRNDKPRDALGISPVIESIFGG